MAYHGGMDQESRILIQQQFLHNQLDIICATSAFGMGINKENIRFVIHFHMPQQWNPISRKLVEQAGWKIQYGHFILFSGR